MDSRFDPTRLAWQLGLVILLVVVNSFFALAEYALITVRKTRIRQLVEEGNRSARMVDRMLQHPTRMMATIQTGVTIIATLSSMIAATSAVSPLAAWISAHFPGFVARHAAPIALILVTLPVALLSLVVGEIAPKSLAVRHSERLSLIAVHPVAWLQWLLAPAVAVLTLLSNLAVRPFGGTASFTTPAVNEQELKMMVEASEEQGVLDTEETEMIHSILDFGDTVARRVMTPRIDVTAVDIGTPLADLITRIGESGHSRIPVYEGDLDNIVGIVHAKDLLVLCPAQGGSSEQVRAVMRAPYFIPESKKIDELLAEFQRSKNQMAIVRDEYGVTSGLITIEDLVEEIVGEIADEYDVDEPMVQVVDQSTTIVDGLMPLSDVNDRMGLDLPEDEFDTIGGFVFSLLGHQAQQGERTEYGNVEFVVEATDGRRITKVRMVQHPHSEGTGAAGPPADVVREAASDGGAQTRVETAGVETAPGARAYLGLGHRALRSARLAGSR